MHFKLHERIDMDSDSVGFMPLCEIRLSKEDIGPWLILVPRINDITEVHQLSHKQQVQLIRESSTVSTKLEEVFSPDKINVASLGNIVSQLHIHHVARYTDDIAWPGPIWGNTTGLKRNDKEQQKLIHQIQVSLDETNGFVTQI
ncbi:HIT domain-containing protein [Shewanella sp. VB17]|uniref:HIT domain-containing protein n=1 Tax=Shewanella sp. VB17 TaxID=2739432 RepID=UPI00156328F7|nr:HIT domain-containing protein [Shewanella sp. VB17]NRD72381.1 HIT domain-containing protein [Shewanella sp. VB17]